MTVLLYVIAFWFQTPAVFAQDNRDEIVAGVPKDFPPQYSIDRKTDKPDGFAIDVMNALAGKAGLKVSYVLFDEWQDIHQALREGRVDGSPTRE